MLDFHPGDLLWCTDHLDVGVVLRAEALTDGELAGELWLEVHFTCGLTCLTADDESHADYRRARRRDGVWEYDEGDAWHPIDFSRSHLCPEPPVFADDPDDGPFPDLGPRIDLTPYLIEGGAGDGEMA